MQMCTQNHALRFLEVKHGHEEHFRLEDTSSTADRIKHHTKREHSEAFKTIKPLKCLKTTTLEINTCVYDTFKWAQDEMSL